MISSVFIMIYLRLPVFFKINLKYGRQSYSVCQLDIIVIVKSLL